MTKPIKKIVLFLILIIALPILFFLFKESSNLNATEQIIESIYKKQLDAVLFSINQYSEDIARNWMNRIEAYDGGSGFTSQESKEKLLELLNENPSIKYVFSSDTSYKRIEIIVSDEAAANRQEIRVLLTEQNRLIKKLFSYHSKNFQKIEPFTQNKIKTQYLVSASKSKFIYGIAINKNEFVNRELSAKFRSISQSEFSFAVFDFVSGRTISSIDFSEGQKLQSSRKLWMIPDFQMGIGIKGQTINQLVYKRNNLNMIFLAGLFVIMITAAWYGFKSIKREIELAQIKNDFVSNVSHELRTPLALINMFAETLSLGRVKTEEKRREYYGIIQQETERLSKIVNKILNFSKIEAGKWKYNFAEVDLNEIVRKVYEVYKFHLTKSGIEFVLEEYSGELKIYADSESVSEAIINLVDNAVKYSVDSKKVLLKIGLNNNTAFVDVIDHGVGISAEDQKRIFEKFFRVSTKEVHNTKGTGLGLALVKHIIEANKGAISVKSEVGKGSTFKISFPLLEM